MPTDPLPMFIPPSRGTSADIPTPANPPRCSTRELPPFFLLAEAFAPFFAGFFVALGDIFGPPFGYPLHLCFRQLAFTIFFGSAFDFCFLGFLVLGTTNILGVHATFCLGLFRELAGHRHLLTVKELQEQQLQQTFGLRQEPSCLFQQHQPP